ncbi:MAG TPA: putative quinol monooxygenase [Nevskiaceae bacterium]|nr:putative quinol monooxygenase [Nevskiaceae bacterium]
MLTILFYMTGKPGADAQLEALVREMVDESRAHDGCVTYTFHRQADDAREWMLIEEWRDKAALNGHVERMKARFGEPPPGARLPARLDALTESSRFAFYQALS